MRLGLGMASVSALAFLLFGSTQALAAPGGGAVKTTATCDIAVPGYGDASGYATYMATPGGKEKLSCTAILADLSLAPIETVSFSLGGCDFTVYWVGLVTVRC